MPGMTMSVNSIAAGSAENARGRSQDKALALHALKLAISKIF
jgi:hypothetical protein